jgi:cyanophycin synthetase
VLVGTFRQGKPVHFAGPERCATLAEEVGLTLPDDTQMSLPLERRVEGFTKAVRRHLSLLEIEIENSALPADAFVIPLEPEELAVPIVEFALYCFGAPAPEQLRRGLEALEAGRDKLYPDIHMATIGNECRKRGIPWRRLWWSNKLYQIGEGAHLSRLDLTVTSRTPRLATGIAGDKAETNRLLARFGLPVARQICVTRAEDAWPAAQKIGLPVVVKPRIGNMGRGVSINLKTQAEVVGAARQAQQVSAVVAVESQIMGADHRVLIARGRIVAVARRTPPKVIGNGIHTIRELVASENASPHRSKTKLTILKTIEVDKEMERRVAAHGYTLDSVPPQGAEVFLRFGGGMSKGATAIDLTDQVHPKNAAALLKAAALVGLDIAGIDFLISDISKPYDEVGGAICEVNSRVATRAHMAAELGTDRSVASRLLDAIYTERNNGRVPTVLVVGSGSGDLAVRIAEGAEREIGRPVAVAGRERVAIGGEALDVKPVSLWQAHQIVTEDPDVHLVVLEVEAERIESEGLAVSKAELVVLADGWQPQSAGDVRPVLEKLGAPLIQTMDLEAVMSHLREQGHLAPGLLDATARFASPLDGISSSYTLANSSHDTMS